MTTCEITATIDELEALYSYEPPEFAEMDEAKRSPVAQFVGVIAVIVTFWGSVLAWCYFVCKGSGGLAQCDIGWFTAKAVCKE